MPRASRSSGKRRQGDGVEKLSSDKKTAAVHRRSPRLSVGSTPKDHIVKPPVPDQRTVEESFKAQKQQKGDSPSSTNPASSSRENGASSSVKTQVNSCEDADSNDHAAENGFAVDTTALGTVEKKKEEEEDVDDKKEKMVVGTAAGSEPAAAGLSTARREAWAKVARARGSHFARPDKKPSSTRGGGSGGGDRERVATRKTADNDGPKESWPGPWSEARRLIEEREKAAARRESTRVNGTVHEAAASGDDSDEDQSRPSPVVKLEWKPRGSGSRPEKFQGVPTLFRLCLDLLAENFSHVESLGDVSAEVRNHLAGVLCRELKLTTEALRRLSEPGVTELILPDCSRIEPDQMRDSLLQCRSTLRVLRLGTCGRCVGDATVEALSAAGGFPRLEIAALSGTYRLTDSGVVRLLRMSPKLIAVEIPANSRISRESLEAMVDAERPVGSALTSLSLTDCIHLGLEALDPLRHMACLESLSLSGVVKLTDEALGQALRAHGWKLRHLDISDCSLITDDSLKTVGECCDVLESFSLGMCPLLTSGAIQELFQYNGSSSDVSSSNTLASAVPEVPQKSKPGKGNGKGKGKSNGKGKGKAAEDTDDFSDGVLDELEKNAYFDGGEMDSSGGKRPSFSTMASSVGNGGVPNGETGHAMLKSRLRRVSLRGLSQVDDGAVVAIAAACSDGLRELDLKGVALITDNSLAALARFCFSSLESLDLSFCRRVTDDGLGHLVDASPKMRSLRLWGCTQVGERFLKGHSRKELVISRY